MKVIIAALAIDIFLANLLASRKRLANLPALTTTIPTAINTEASPRLKSNMYVSPSPRRPEPTAASSIAMAAGQGTNPPETPNRKSRQ